jgi:putative transposase
VAHGIRYDGRREVIGYMKAKAESEAAWESFLDDLYKRGLTGKRLKLIVADGAGGLFGSFTNTSSLDRIAYGIFWIINRMWEDTCLTGFTQSS